MLPTTGISLLTCMLALADPGPVGQTHPLGAPPDLAADAEAAPPAPSEVAGAGVGGFSEPAPLATPADHFAAILMTALQATVAARPPFVYGPGAYGYGYYAAPGTQTAPAGRTTTTTVVPASSRSSSSRGRYREFGSGRSIRLAKPWLRQFD